MVNYARSCFQLIQAKTNVHELQTMLHELTVGRVIAQAPAQRFQARSIPSQFP
jgi:hypothetical protein